jgi:hypothetical protein
MRPGVALTDAPLLTVVYLASSFSGVDPEPVSKRLFAAPTVVMTIFISCDLYADGIPPVDVQCVES